MRHNPRNGFYVCAVALLLTIPEAWAGGWPLAPGTTETITSLTWLTADERYDAGGNKVWTSRYTKLEISPYVEYGLTGNLTLIGELAWSREKTEYFGTEFRNDDLSRLKAGGRLALGVWEDTLFSLQPLFTLNLAGTGDDPAATESGDIDSELALVLARSETLSGLDIFSVQEIAYRYRDSSRPDEVRADITLGLKPRTGTMLLMKSLNTVAVTSASNGDRHSTSRLALSVVQALPETLAPGWSVEAGAEQTIFGRSTIHDTTVRIALWRRF